MSGTHARFSPSSAERIFTCPASLLLSEGLPDTVNWYAVEGTIGHAIHEYGLLHPDWGISRFEGMCPQEFMQPTEMHPDEWAVVPEDWRVDRAFLDAIQRSIDYCLEYDGEHYVEQRVNISKYTPLPDQFGTCDHACITRDGTLVITDLKMGTGVKVIAEQNKQLALYALGFLEEHDWLHAFDRVIIRVSQPRLDHFDVWETTADELRVLGAKMRERFTLALQPDAPFGPSEKACQFCKVKATCPALYQRALEVSKGWFDDLTQPIEQPNLEGSWPISTPDARLMKPEHIALLLDNADMIEGFLKAVRAHATHKLMHGEAVPHYKLVEGRSNRVIANVAGYETFLREHKVEPYHPPELIGVTDAEKALKGPAKKGLSAFLTKPRGKPTLAHESDKREPYTLTADNMFGDVSDDL
jgi:hypothetical protein